MSTDNFFDFFTKSDSAASDYVKFENGDKRTLRILSKPIKGYELFVNNKPVRWAPDAVRPEHAISDERPKTFLACVVYEYGEGDDDGRVKLWSFSQRKIIAQMAMLFKEEHWAAYELIVVRVGKGLNTDYNVTGVKSPIEENLLAFAAESKKYIDLSKLYTGENPFIQELPELGVKQAKPKTDDLPF